MDSTSASRLNPARFPKNSEIIPVKCCAENRLVRSSQRSECPAAGRLAVARVRSERGTVWRCASRSRATGRSRRNPVRRKPRIPRHFPGSCNSRVPAGRDSGPCEILHRSPKTGSLPARTKFQRRRSPRKSFRRLRRIARAIPPAHLFWSRLQRCRPVSVRIPPENLPSAPARTPLRPHQTTAQTPANDFASAAVRLPRIARHIPSRADAARRWLRISTPAAQTPGPAARAPAAPCRVLRWIAVRWSRAFLSHMDRQVSPNRSLLLLLSPGLHPASPPHAPGPPSVFPPNRSTARILPPADSADRLQRADPAQRNAPQAPQQNSSVPHLLR